MWDFRIHNLLSLAQLLSMMPTLPLYYSSRRSIQIFMMLYTPTPQQPPPLPLGRQDTSSTHNMKPLCQQRLKTEYVGYARRRNEVETVVYWYPRLPDRTIFSSQYHAVTKTYFVHFVFHQEISILL